MGMDRGQYGLTLIKKTHIKSDENKDGKAIDNLMCVTMPVINNTVCGQTFGASSIIASTICTSGANAKSTCRV